jgi:hypothetical protein
LQGEQFRDELRPLCTPLRDAKMSEMLSLPPQLFVAEGTDRKCFRHPTDDKRCIKVLHPDTGSGRFWRELRYYRCLQRRGVAFRHLTPYRGLVDTNLGRGAVFDLVLDDDARISRSLHHYLLSSDPGFNAWVVEEMERLQQDLYDQWIVFHDLNPTNILVKRLGYDEYRMVVIDGIGHNHFVPLASYSARFARKKLVRVWNRRYQQWYSAFPLIARALKPYPAI